MSQNSYDHVKRRPEDVKSLFDNIAPGYDRLNRIVSFGLDNRWRRRVAKLTENVRCERVLDVCTGTGDLAIEIARFWDGAARVDGIDFSAGAVKIGQEKAEAAGLGKSVFIQEGDATQLPFNDETFDAVSVGFGFRNIQQREQALREFIRVTKPGGMFVCLEASQPPAITKPFYYFYMLYVVPLLAGIAGTDREAYKYLGRSIKSFPSARIIASMIEEAGWNDVAVKRVGLGSVAIHTAVKPCSKGA